MTLPQEIILRLIELYWRLPLNDLWLTDLANSIYEEPVWHQERAQKLSIKDTIQSIDTYISKLKEIGGNFHPIDLSIAAEWNKLGVDGYKNEFQTQYFYEEAIKTAKKFRNQNLEKELKLDLAAILRSAHSKELEMPD